MRDFQENSPRHLTAGNAEALAQFTEQHRDRLLAFIRNRLSSQLRGKVEPEDILQDVCAEALVALAKVDLANSELLAHLFRLAERRIIQTYRHYFTVQKRDAAREVSFGLQSGKTSRVDIFERLIRSSRSPLQKMIRSEQKAELNSALADLSQIQREVFLLRYRSGLPTKQIAARLGKSDGAVRVLLSRTMKRLSATLTSPVSLATP